MEFKITKEQINELAEWHSSTNDLLKGWFPKAFEKELEIGKWYKSETREAIVFITNEVKNKSYIGYGFDGLGNWTDKWYYRDSVSLIKATRDEVKQALINEAKKRGYGEGVVFKSLDGYNNHTIHEFTNDFDLEMNYLRVIASKNEWRCYGGGGFSNPAIFKEGIWAEIIKEKPKRKMTVSEICNELGEEIEIVKE